MDFTPGREDITQLDEMYRQVLEDAPDGIFIMTASSRFMFVNRQGAAMLGYEQEAFQNMPVSSVFPPEVISGLSPAETDVECHFLETVLRRKDAKIFHAEVNCR